jgi:hypothetical protein
MVVITDCHSDHIRVRCLARRSAFGEQQLDISSVSGCPHPIYFSWISLSDTILETKVVPYDPIIQIALMTYRNLSDFMLLFARHMYQSRKEHKKSS